MSNYLAIATVTATLQRLLQASIQADVEGARVTTLRPENLGEGAPESGLNVFLYHILSNPAHSNGAVAGRQRRGEVTKKSQAALDLYYLFSFYGNEVELEPQRLLGSVVRTLEDYGSLTPDVLQDTIDNRAYPFLAASDLPEQSEAIRIERQDLEMEDLSNLWSGLFEASYLLSVAYKVTVVLVEGDVPARRALPVRDRYLGAIPSSIQPVIEQVLCSAGRYRPILRDSSILIRGKQLEAPNAYIKLGPQLIEPQTVAPNQVVLDLATIPAEQLRAGVQGLQIVHPRDEPRTVFVERGSRTPPASRAASATADPAAAGSSQWVESNVEAFVLRPTILDVAIADVQGSEDEPRSALVRVQFDLTVNANSRVVLVLNERVTQAPAEYLFTDRLREQNSSEIEIAIAGVQPGEYLVRATIDGAESLLQADFDPQSATYEQYVGPLLIVP
ncbi:MAG: DUF4255 domain-containing protein [Cyanobacteria bacterium P01_H01_bin.162]